MMRYLWVDAGNDPDFGKGDRNGVTGYFLAAFDSRTTIAQFQKIVAHGSARGVYAVSNWPQFVGKTPVEMAATLVAEYKRLAAGVSNLRLQWDDERKDPDAILAVLTEVRRLLPNVGLSWTMESRQGGWIGPKLKDNGGKPGAFVQGLIDLNVRVVPQMYNGDMTATGDTLAEDRDLRSRGVPDGVVSPFVDAAKLQYGVEGYLFTQGRLP